MAGDRSISVWRSIGKFAVVTVSIGAVGGLLLYEISQIGIKRETVYTYDEEGEKRIYRIHYRPLVWLFAFLEYLPSPRDLLHCQSKKNGS